MFVNSSLGEIFLVNSATNTIHAASQLSERCGITGENNGRFGILPACDQQERDLMILQFGKEYSFLSYCPYCFPDLAKKDASGRAAMPEEGLATMAEKGRAPLPEDGRPQQASSERGE